MADNGNESRYEPSSPDERARKQARVRGLTDPLGSMGFRETPKRYRREARARRGVFGGAAASFVIGTALIIAASERGADSTSTSAETVPPTSQVVSGQGAGQPQSVTRDSTQPAGVFAETATAPESSSTVVSDDERTELLVKQRPALSIPSHEDDDDRYESDDDDDRYEEDDDDGRASSSILQNQGVSVPSTSSGSGTQTEIVIPQSKPHTQTSSTRD